MKKLKTASGRIFSVTVQGGRLTLRDTMVAASVYLNVLEEQFSTADDLVLCFKAWLQDAALGPGNLPDDQLARVKRWVAAHERADEAARPWLSDAAQQSFLLSIQGAK